MSNELKIKIKSLAEEARIIRHEERKLHGFEKWKLQHHRKTVVRNAARRTLLAYQVLRKRDFRPNLRKERCMFHDAEDYKEVSRMVGKYGGQLDELQRAGLHALEAELGIRRSGGNHGQTPEDSRSHAA